MYILEHCIHSFILVQTMKNQYRIAHDIVTTKGDCCGCNRTRQFLAYNQFAKTIIQ